MKVVCLRCGREADGVEDTMGPMALCRACGFEWGHDAYEGLWYVLSPAGGELEEVPAGCLAAFDAEEA